MVTLSLIEIQHAVGQLAEPFHDCLCASRATSLRPCGSIARLPTALISVDVGQIADSPDLHSGFTEMPSTLRPVEEFQCHRVQTCPSVSPSPARSQLIRLLTVGIRRD